MYIIFPQTKLDMKKSLKIISLILFFLILCRGSIYRLLIKYSDVGTRPEIQITNQNLISKIKSSSSYKAIDSREIAKIATEITNEQLKFTTKNAISNPNQLIHIGKANCVGYASMFNSIANYIIKENNLQSELKAEHKIGKLELFGVNIHPYLKSPYFKDHDFNEIKNLNTGKSIFVDPSLSDYLHIDRIMMKTE